MEEVGVDRVHRRRVRIFQLSGWTWEDPGATPFVLFVASHASADDTVEIRHFAAEAVESGCAYVCAWGEGCELVHDLFDKAALAIDRFVMSTSHADDSLAEAVYFSLTVAWPDEDEFPDGAEAAIVLAVEEPWIAEVRRLTADQVVLTEEK